MSYETYFDGVINITPQLPQDFLTTFNAMVKRRNNKYGDGEQGSFDQALHGKYGYDGQGSPQPRDPAWPKRHLISETDSEGESLSSVPGVYCCWGLENRKSSTDIAESSMDVSSDYIEWLQYVIDHIKQRFPHSRFSGVIDWRGEDSEDLGRILVSPKGIIRTKWGYIVYR